MRREVRFHQAINEALDQCMAADRSVYVIALGATDPKGIFGTTLGLLDKYPGRVLDMPLSENAMTGVVIGSALVGQRPVLAHQRLDFALLSMEQIVNQAAKWHYMFGGKRPVPIVIRMIIGRGWGQGPQHSQSLQAWFAHIPGLKVVMPATPGDAKGLLISSIEDNNPVIFFEHRWLHGIIGHVPTEMYRVPIGQARVAREGKDVTIAATSLMVLESLRASAQLAELGVSCEVLDLRTLRPLDKQTIIRSVSKTRRLIVADTGAVSFGVGAEVVASVVESDAGPMLAPARRIGLPDAPTPTTRSLADRYYPRSIDIVNAALDMFRMPRLEQQVPESSFLDVPDPSFIGPF